MRVGGNLGSIRYPGYSHFDIIRAMATRSAFDANHIANFSGMSVLKSVRAGYLTLENVLMNVKILTGWMSGNRQTMSSIG